MFRTALKRSVAALGVVAGLLAVAGPASAVGGEHPEQVSYVTNAPQPSGAMDLNDIEAIDFNTLARYSRGNVNAAFAVPDIGDEVLTFDSHTSPHADGIIAILIGATGTNHDGRDQDEARLAAPGPLTAPLGSSKGSFIDGSLVDGAR